MEPFHSHKEFFSIFLLLSSVLLDPSDAWEFVISQKRHPMKDEIIPIPGHIPTETREVYVWIEVKKPSFSNSDVSDHNEYDAENVENDCLPATIAQETESYGSVTFKASHPDLPDQMQDFSVNINETSKQRRVLCLSNFSQKSDQAIRFEATVDKPVCRDVTVVLDIGGECANIPEGESIETQTSQSKANHEDKTDTTFPYIIAIVFLVVMLIIVTVGKQILAMFRKTPRVVNIGHDESDSLECVAVGDNLSKSISRGDKRSKKSKKDL